MKRLTTNLLKHDFYTDHGSPLCAEIDPELWFPDKGHSAHIPKNICNTCPVKAGCLLEALSNGVHEGIWGGTGGKERRRMLRTPELIRKAIADYHKEVEVANENTKENTWNTKSTN